MINSILHTQKTNPQCFSSVDMETKLIKTYMQK